MGRTFENLFSSFQSATKGKLNTSLGTTQSVYKEEIFEGMTDGEKKKARTKIRKFVISVFETLVSTTCTDTNKKDLVKSFVEFYIKTYSVNDFSVSSLCNDNSKHKDLFTKGLEIVKKYNKK